MSPEQARQYTLHSREATVPSIAQQVDVPRAEQGQHRQHGGRASVRLYNRDDVWGALACQRLVVQKVADGFRPLTAQGRGAQIPIAEPPVKIDPLTVPMEVVPDDFDSTPISQTTATKVRVETSHRPRHSSKLQTLLAHPGDKEEPTVSSVTSSEPSTPEEKPPSRQQTPVGILYVTNVLTGVVFVAVNARAGADFSRSMEHDGKRFHKACRLPSHTAGDMLHDAAAGCDPDRAGSSDINLEL